MLARSAPLRGIVPTTRQPTPPAEFASVRPTGFDTSAVRVSPTSALGFGRDDGVTTAPTTSAYSTSRAMATTGARQVGQAA